MRCHGIGDPSPELQARGKICPFSQSAPAAAAIKGLVIGLRLFRFLFLLGDAGTPCDHSFNQEAGRICNTGYRCPLDERHYYCYIDLEETMAHSTPQ